MPSIKDLWPDKWLRADHLQGKRVVVTIARVDVEELYNPRTRQEQAKIVLTFHGKALRLPINKTQARALAQITQTDDYNAWTGARVVLTPARAPNGSDTIAISAHLPTTEA